MMDLPTRITSAARRASLRCIPRPRTRGEVASRSSDSSAAALPLLHLRDVFSRVHPRQLRAGPPLLTGQRALSRWSTSSPLNSLYGQQTASALVGGRGCHTVFWSSERASLQSAVCLSSLDSLRLMQGNLTPFPTVRGSRTLSRCYHSPTSSTASSSGTLEEGLASPEAVNILRGVPSYHVKEKDTTKNFLELDPDNPTRLLEHFSELLRRGNLEPNEAQKALMQKLQVLLDEIEAFNLRSGDAFDPMTARPPPLPLPFPADSPSPPRQSTQTSSERKGGLLTKLFGFGGRSSDAGNGMARSLEGRMTMMSPGYVGKDEEREDSFSRFSFRPPIRGLYIYGGVGQGKTMIMDAFFDCLNIQNKLRLHFHQFTQEVQEKLHRINAERRYEDPLFEVSKQIRSQAQVLCFDEFQVTNIADAMVLKRLFEALFSFGAIVVATSNRPPSELYAGGLNRDRFLPFIDLLLDCCEVFHIDTHKDYRLSKLTASSYGLYFVPPREEEEILKQLKYLVQNNSLSPGPGCIQVSTGRNVQVPVMSGGFALFSFEDLCARSVGPGDYLAISKHFHTIFLTDIPDLHDKMDEYPNEIRRFINLIDVLYEKHIRVIFDAAAPPFRLLGIPPIVNHFEILRQKIQNKFVCLQDFLDALKPFCSAAQSSSSSRELAVSEESWRKASKTIIDLPDEVALDIFQKLCKTQNASDLLPLEIFRSSLFFHAQNFDVEQPTEKNAFLFSKTDTKPGSSKTEEEGVSPACTPYELFNEGGSSGAQDNQFAYIRTISRIRDMTSASYLEAHQKLFHLNDLQFFGIQPQT